jgi:glyoxylase-like metal-dependent hydrolase (beta-lactamase superfamily II)
MIRIKLFTFNAFSENTYILSDETGECVIVDAGCYEEQEQQELVNYIEGHKLKPVHNILTHCHIDHILGIAFIAGKFDLLPEYHKESEPFLVSAGEIAGSFGYQLKSIPGPKGFLDESKPVLFGTSSLKVLYTPGHADGSVCFYNAKDGFVITGDVLFRETIGRTDLPSGNFDLLMSSIRQKLFTLPDETVVYPGHGPETTIGFEKVNNPFIR